jgi:hypothetical protein
MTRWMRWWRCSVRTNREQRRRIARAQRAGDRRLALESLPLADVILPGLPGGAPYVPEAEFERMALEMFEAVAMMTPGMEARKLAAGKWGIAASPPKARVGSGLVEVRGDVSLERLREFGIHGV